MSTLPLVPPKFRAFDSNGAPLSGGKLYSYAAGTTTPQDTFTTRAGNIANTNPVILNGNGEADVWTTPGVLYKFLLKDAGDVIQWTVDNVPSGGTGSSSTAAANTIEPGGRLTLTSMFPVTTTDVTNASTVFYTPYDHNQVPLYDGSAWSANAIASELSQALSDTTKSPSAASDDNAYDMFIWNDSGTLRLSRGPAWASQTSRGTGAGTTEIVRVDGRLINKWAISNGPAANCGLYVGSIFVVGSGVNDRIAARHVWNNYNRVPRPMRVIEATVSWTYSTDAFRQANGAGTNELDFFLGRSREPVSAEAVGAVVSDGTATYGSGVATVGIGLDSSTTDNAAPSSSVQLVAVDSKQLFGHPRATYQDFPGEGRHTLRWLERGDGLFTQTWYGTSTSSVRRATSGIWGTVFA